VVMCKVGYNGLLSASREDADPADTRETRNLHRVKAHASTSVDATERIGNCMQKDFRSVTIRQIFLTPLRCLEGPISHLFVSDSRL